MNIAQWAIGYIKPILFITVVLCVVGAILYATFPVSILPDVTFPRVVVIGETEDLPVKMVEASITRPMEEAIATIPNVHRIRSKTKRGSTEVSVDFTADTDIIIAEQLVSAKVNEVRVDFPVGTHTEVERMNPTVFPVLGLTVNSKSLTPTELWNLATYTLKPRLARVPGVARVVVQGGRAPEIAVNLRTDALETFALSPTDVVNALSSANEIRSVGRLDREFKRFQVTVNGELRTLDDIKNVVVIEKDSGPVRVGQVADVVPSEEDKTTVVSANGAESVLLNVIRQPSANSVSMVSDVNEELGRLQKDLPNDVRIRTFYDQSVLIKEAVASVRDAVLIGAGLSVLVLLMFLRDVRATVATAIIIPTTLLISFVLMRLAGLTLNLMTLGALAIGIGLVIDTGIVVVEAVCKNFASTDTVADAVKSASRQITAPLVSSTITAVVVFLPLAFLTGVAGAFFSALALTLTISLMVSLVFALCVSPSLCAAFLKRSSDHGQGRLMMVILGGYQNHLSFLLARRWLVVPIIGLTAAGSWFITGRLETGFMPAMDEGAFVVDYWTPPGTSLEESDRLLRKVDAILLATPEISTFSRRTGTELGFAITASNSGDYAVMVKPNRHRDIEEIMSEVRAKIQAQIPGLDVEFIQVLQDLIGDLAGNPNPVEIKLFGENKEEVERLAQDISDRLGQIKGLVDVKSGLIEDGPEVRFTVDQGEAGRRGATVQTIADQANASLIGTVATEVLQEDRQIPVRVRLPESLRTNIPAIVHTLIQTPSGRVRLQDLAKVDLIAGTTQSNREDQRRLVPVSAHLENIDLGTAIRGVRKVLGQTQFPPGVNAVIAGQFESQKESFANLAFVLGAAVLLVFMVMVIQFRSFVAPGVILILMPLSLFGAVIGLWLTGTALNVSAFMGVIMLAGIVVKNGILLLDRAQRSLEEGADMEQALMDAGEARIRPILMTSLTAILGLMPLALGLGAGSEMQKPLAIAVMGGLAFSTILTLVVGPLLFASMVRVRPKPSSDAGAPT